MRRGEEAYKFHFCQNSDEPYNQESIQTHKNKILCISEPYLSYSILVINTSTFKQLKCIALSNFLHFSSLLHSHLVLISLAIIRIILIPSHSSARKCQRRRSSRRRLSTIKHNKNHNNTITLEYSPMFSSSALSSSFGSQ